MRDTLAHHPGFGCVCIAKLSSCNHSRIESNKGPSGILLFPCLPPSARCFVSSHYELQPPPAQPRQSIYIKHTAGGGEIFKQLRKLLPDFFHPPPPLLVFGQWDQFFGSHLLGEKTGTCPDSIMDPETVPGHSKRSTRRSSTLWLPLLALLSNNGPVFVFRRKVSVPDFSNSDINDSCAVPPPRPPHYDGRTNER